MNRRRNTPRRVVSLIASSTEMVCAMGFADALVGRSHECDYPPEVKNLPVCSEPNFEIQGTSLEVDERVKSMLKSGKPLYRVDAEVLRALAPDVIITQDHCEVCAVSLAEVEKIACETLPSRPEIVALKPDRLADIWRGARRIAEALHEPRRGEDFVISRQAEMKKIAQKARRAVVQPTVACLEWLDPLMAAGNWVPELVEMLGAKNLFGLPGKHSPWMTWAELSEKNPDIIVVMPCGWDIAKGREEIKALQSRPKWGRLEAVQKGQVYLTDGNQYFNRPGPRVVESLEILAEIFYPDLFSACLRGQGWIHL